MCIHIHTVVPKFHLLVYFSFSQMYCTVLWHSNIPIKQSIRQIAAIRNTVQGRAKLKTSQEQQGRQRIDDGCDDERHFKPPILFVSLFFPLVIKWLYLTEMSLFQCNWQGKYTSAAEVAKFRGWDTFSEKPKTVSRKVTKNTMLSILIIRLNDCTWGLTTLLLKNYGCYYMKADTWQQSARCVGRVWWLW